MTDRPSLSQPASGPANSGQWVGSSPQGRQGLPVMGQWQLEGWESHCELGRWPLCVPVPTLLLVAMLPR